MGHAQDLRDANMSYASVIGPSYRMVTVRVFEVDGQVRLLCAGRVRVGTRLPRARRMQAGQPAREAAAFNEIELEEFKLQFPQPGRCGADRTRPSCLRADRGARWKQAANKYEPTWRSSDAWMADAPLAARNAHYMLTLTACNHRARSDASVR
jgi:hypothetical protein